MQVVKTIAFTDGLSCERCLAPIAEKDLVAMLIETLGESEGGIIWCISCADEVASTMADVDWVDNQHYSCMQCGFVIETGRAEEMGWKVDPGGVGVYCFFCAYESTNGPQMSIPLSSSTIPQESPGFNQGRAKAILWVGGLLQIILIWNIGLDWLTLIPLLALGYLAGRMRKLYATEPGFPQASGKKRGTG